MLRIHGYLQRYSFINYGVFSRQNPMHGKMPFKVVVVGSGVSGLMAARQLTYFGLDVSILEARVCDYVSGVSVLLGVLQCVRRVCVCVCVCDFSGPHWRSHPYLQEWPVCGRPGCHGDHRIGWQPPQCAEEAAGTADVQDPP